MSERLSNKGNTAPMADPTVTIGTIVTTLATVEREFTLPKKVREAAAAAGKKVDSIGTVREWRTMTERTVAATVYAGADDEVGADVTMDSARYSVSVPNPGKVPTSATVAVFGETVTVSLAKYVTRAAVAASVVNGKKVAAKPERANYYGATTISRNVGTETRYVRGRAVTVPRTLTYAVEVKVTPSADGAAWRIAARVAQ